MTLLSLRELLRLGRELEVPDSAIEIALECGLLAAADALESQRTVLRCVRRLMHDLDVNAPGAILILKMRREVEALQAENRRLRQPERFIVESWLEGAWRELTD